LTYRASILLTLQIVLLASVLPSQASVSEQSSGFVFPKNFQKTITEPSGQVSTLAYDTRLRLQKKTDAVGVIDYGYDLADKLKTVTEGGVITLRFWIIIVGHRNQGKRLIRDLSFSKISKFHRISMPHVVRRRDVRALSFPI